ncbi:MAG TPA: aromatic ring-hydroxylating dioxygenase subunit alpha [Terriglobales bacterium]|jgi:choline monooxygenase|nr:aromatic ring-hydroxylating dioxygenase subunit alpha [Terriglobales bacterium]
MKNGLKNEMSVAQILASYDVTAPLTEASTIPSSWYVDARIADLERQTLFSRTWQVMGRIDQVEKAGQFVTATVAGEPLVAVRGHDGILRAFYNVCRHHAAAVVTEPCGQASILHCPYHGWNYGLDGTLKGMPEFDGVKNFERKDNGLVPVKVDTWEKFIFVNLDADAAPLTEFLGGLMKRVAPLGLHKLHYFASQTYEIHCNWKVFVDNYLDGGYHVPHLHKGLNSILDYKQYTIENEDRYCLQSSPMVSSGEDAAIGTTRRGDRAWYFWLHPNFMFNCYEGYLDTNLVIPVDVEHCRVIFDFYFSDVSESARAYNEGSVAVGNRVQDEDLGICEAVQRGLKSRAYGAGRLSARREAGEQLFHQLLAEDLKSGMEQGEFAG